MASDLDEVNPSHFGHFLLTHKPSDAMKPFPLSTLTMITQNQPTDTHGSDNGESDDFVSFNYRTRSAKQESTVPASQLTSPTVHARSCHSVAKSTRHIIPVLLGMVAHLWRH